MSPDEFKSLVVRHRDAAVEHLEGARRSERLEAMRFYRGDNLNVYGNSGDGLSTVVSRDFMEAVESVLPGLIKPFVAGDETVRFEPTGPEDEEGAKQATEYINYLFQNHNDAVRVIYDFAKDGMMFRLGVAKVVLETIKDKTLETYTGLGPEDIQALEAEADYELIGDVMQAEDGTLEARVQLTKDRKMYRVYVIAENEFLFEGRLATMDEGRFFGHRATKTAGDFIAMGLDRKKILSVKSNETENDEMYDRFVGDNARETGKDDDISRLVTIDELYIRCDYEGTGALGWRKVIMGAAHSEVISNEEVDDHPYETWTPMPLPHKLVGMSFYDITRDIQMQKTALVRETMNALYLANRPQREVVEGQVNFEDLLNPEVGGLCRVKQPGMIREISTGGEAVMQQSLAMIEHLDAVREARTGSTRYNQGMDADTLNHTATGISMIQNASMQRQELVARLLAEGLKGIFRKMLKLVMLHCDKKEVIRLRGKWVEMDPTEWKSGYDMSVAVGLGTGNRDQQVGQLMQLLQLDEKIVELQGGTNGPMLTTENIFEKLKRLVEAMGFKGLENYYTDPSAEDQQQQAPAGPTPEQAQQQHEAQQAQMEQQADQQKFQAQAQLDMQKAQAEQQHDMQMAEMQGQIEMHKAELVQHANEAKLAADQAAQERQAVLEAEKLRSAELIAQVQAENVSANRDFERWKAELQAQTQLEMAQISANTTLQATQIKAAHEAVMAETEAARETRLETVGPANAEAKPAPVETKGHEALASAIEGMSETIKEIRKPRKILRGKDGKVTGVE